MGARFIRMDLRDAAVSCSGRDDDENVEEKVNGASNATGRFGTASGVVQLNDRIPTGPSCRIFIEHFKIVLRKIGSPRLTTECHADLQLL